MPADPRQGQFPLLSWRLLRTQLPLDRHMNRAWLSCLWVPIVLQRPPIRLLMSCSALIRSARPIFGTLFLMAGRLGRLRMHSGPLEMLCLSIDGPRQPVGSWSELWHPPLVAKGERGVQGVNIANDGRLCGAASTRLVVRWFRRAAEHRCMNLR